MSTPKVLHKICHFTCLKINYFITEMHVYHNRLNNFLKKLCLILLTGSEEERRIVCGATCARESEAE